MVLSTEKGLLGLASMCQLPEREARAHQQSASYRATRKLWHFFLQNRKQKDKENQYTMQQNIESAAVLDV